MDAVITPFRSMLGEASQVRAKSLVGVPLTPREKQVAELVHQLLTNRMIARKLGCQEGTVKCHVFEIMNKLDVTSRTGIALWWDRTHGKS